MNFERFKFIKDELPFLQQQEEMIRNRRGELLALLYPLGEDYIFEDPDERTYRFIKLIWEAGEEGIEHVELATAIYNNDTFLSCLKKSTRKVNFRVMLAVCFFSGHTRDCKTMIAPQIPFVRKDLLPNFLFWHKMR